MTEQSIGLCGSWDVLIDFDDPADDVETAAERAQWRGCHVPGCWEQVEPNKQADGPVWYRKRFTVPETWSGGPVALQFDGVNYYCEIYVNGELAGRHEGGWSGFQVRAESLLRFGEDADNELLVKVYKQGGLFPLRQCLAGFLPDVGVIFGGIWKPVFVKKLPEIEVQELFVKPRIRRAGIEIEYTLRSPAEVKAPFKLLIEVRDPSGRLTGSKQIVHDGFAEGETVEAAEFIGIEGPGPLQLWSPGSPALYSVELKLFQEDTAVHGLTKRFGMKQVEIRGDQVYLNDSPIYLRGALHWGWYGDHIAPIPSKDEIRDELAKVKESGFNLIKHCLYVPVREYFELADEMGVLLWQELPMWLPEVTPQFKQRVFAQYEDIIREIRNHPSLIVWTLGCELDQSADSTFLSELYDLAKRLTDGAIVRDNSGSGECYGGLLQEYADFYDYHFYTDIHFYSDLLSQFAGSWRESKPWWFGEFCDYDEFRDWDRTIAACGGQPPWWLGTDTAVNPVAGDTRFQYSRQKEKLERIGLPFKDEYLWQNANKSGYVYRKSVLELVRTYRKVTGYVLTSIKDTPIASSAVFDDLGQPKQKPELLRRFNEDTVITLTWDHRRNWVNGGDRLIRWDPYNYVAREFIRPHFFVSHYDAGTPIQGGQLRWSVHTAGSDAPLARGEFASIELNAGEAKEIGVIEVAAPETDQPTTVTLFAELSWGSEPSQRICNEWTFCVFPHPKLTAEEQAAVAVDDPAGIFAGLEKLYPDMKRSSSRHASFEGACVIVTTFLREEHERFMNDGGRVLYVQRGSNGYFDVKPMPFWRESLQLYYRHPVMDAYPHQDHTSLTMFGIASDTVFDREKLPAHMPLMERLDARMFALDSYLFETEVGEGKLLATTLRFEGGLGSQPSGIAYNPGGRYLLEACLKHLLERSGKKGGAS
ncbi:glycoside hydrolase family 2 protein [Paenibacillus thermotolerans]|uniref:glycoside hydrolase family 2 protein n=1 Tax=Paenibacillus thermotolerans TaxID=3027807 RepID=UPI002367EC3D|nr:MULTISPECIES: sugar-binding domain-containing protein [unclassified Paenibacillus]